MAIVAGTSGLRSERMLRTTARNYLPAIAASTALILCYFVTRPYAEIGIYDDWSYIKTAQVLAQTGHIAYNGWGSPMLGWQAYFGALFIKLFGFSFTAVRFSTVIEAMATAFLLQRTLVRAGINSWNASLATMTFVLSPLCLPLDFTFMNDVPGVLSIVVCLYMCLRALQAKSERFAMAWISLAALLNAVGGTSRQIAWLGLLVMVPSTLWLMRRKRRVLVVGCLSWIAGVGIVVAAMHWLAQQPYSISESPIPGRPDLKALKYLVGVGLCGAGQLMLLALPVLLMFAASLRSWNRRKAAVLAAGILCFVVPGVALNLAGSRLGWLVPFLDDYMAGPTFEKLNAIVAGAVQATFLRDGLRLLLTGLVVLGILSLEVCSFAGAQGPPASQRKAESISWQQLGVVLGPFSAAYIYLLVTRGLLFEFYDRHLLPLLAILLLVLTLYYQQRVKENLPWTCALLILIFGSFSVAATHDRFAEYRGYASVINQIRSSGVPATAILGPWEFDGWTEIDEVGHVNDPRIRIPKGAYVSQPAFVVPANCGKDLIDFFPTSLVPHMKPVYVVLRNPGLCVGQVSLPRATYWTWVPLRANSIYSIRLPSIVPR